MPNRKISSGPPELINIIHKVANINNIKNIEYNIESSCEDIDCYFDGIFKVRVRGYRDGQKICKKYVIKSHCDPKKRATFRESYKREFFFYQKILPMLLKVQQGFKIIDGLKLKFLNCDFASEEKDKEAIVVSDPQSDGFRFHDRFHQLDLDHVSLVLKNLAKLHALSFALEKSHPKEFEEIKKVCCTDIQYADIKHVPKSMATYFNTSVNVVKDPLKRKMLIDRESDILSILNKCAMPDIKYRTICHGDCWNNNVMFKYQKTRPVDIVFIDCQLIRYASPVTDISYYLYMSTDEGFISKYYDRVIDLYYKTLTAVLRQCDVDVKEVYPEYIFYQHLKEYSVYGLIEALVSMKIITSETEEALKMTEAKYELCEDGLSEDESQNSPLYVERVNGVVNGFFHRNYSLDAVLSN